MTIFIREWKRNLKSLIIWTLSLAFFVALMMGVYPSFAEDMESLEKLLDAYPEGILAAFGMDRLDLSDIVGWFSMEAVLFITLFGSIYAAMLSSSILSKEENEKTIEFLLAKPVTRYEIATSKLGIVLLNILLFNLLIGLVSFVTFEMFKMEDYNVSLLILLFVGSLLLHLTFASIGFLISIFVTKTKTIYPISIGLVIFTYFLGIAASVSDKLEFLKYFSPFKYVDAPDIILNGKIDGLYLTIMLFIIVVGFGTSFYLYNKKDITV